MKLVYVNELGPNFKGNYVYEFIFSTNLVDIWGEDWDELMRKTPTSEIEFIEKVGIFSNEGLEFDLVQTSDYFSFTDATDDVISEGKDMKKTLLKKEDWF